MSAGIRLKIFDAGGFVAEEEFQGVVELGRQDRNEPGPFNRISKDDHTRLIIASHLEDSVSRHHVKLIPVGDYAVRIENISPAVPVRISDDGQQVGPGEKKEFNLPWVFTLGRKTIRIHPLAAEPEKTLQKLGSATLPPGSGPPSGSVKFPSLNINQQGSLSPEAVIRWLKTMQGVLQAAAGTSEFLERAAMALVDLVGLDTGRVLRYEDRVWKIDATKTSPRMTVDQVLPPSRSVLRRVLEERATFFELPESGWTEGQSLARVSAVVAAPILNRAGEVIGALYGDRNIDSSFTRVSGPISEAEAMLVEVMADGVAAGLERMKQEKKAIEASVLFEQFFTPELAKELIARPDMLQSREQEVTLLFADIRGFSRISEQLGPQATMDWINDVMGGLSDCVLAHNGVLVDYIGDELMAMWGAPQDQPDQALLACRAAIDMIDVIPKLNDRWKTRIDKGFDLGIGINTGTARVGNTGTKLKFKYGPLGNTVNMASRLQNATKQFKTRVLVSGASHTKFQGQLPTRRLGWIRVVGIDKEIEVFELAASGTANWDPLRKGYEQALEAFEVENLAQAARTLGILQLEFPNDGPSLILLSRVVNAKVDPSTYDRVWTLPTK